MNWEIFGLIAGAITICGFIPQIVKGYKTKKLGDLSYLLNIFISIGMFMWLIYGVHINSPAIIISNAIGLILNIFLILMKYYYSRK